MSVKTECAASCTDSAASDDDLDDEADVERVLALVPWADMLNHSSSATERSVLQYDAASDAAVLFAHRNYQEGEEVCDSYGPWLTPSDLLLDYGFVDDENQMNAITVRWRRSLKSVSRRCEA